MKTEKGTYLFEVPLVNEVKEDTICRLLPISHDEETKTRYLVTVKINDTSFNYAKKFIKEYLPCFISSNHSYLYIPITTIEERDTFSLMVDIGYIYKFFSIEDYPAPLYLDYPNPFVASVISITPYSTPQE